MILMRPSYAIEAGTFGKETLAIIEKAGRTCYKSEDRARGKPDHFARMLISKKHESVLEHAGFTVRFIVDRGVSHELVRHRLSSFSQESTRYVDYTGHKPNGECQFIIPPWCDELPEGVYTRIDDDFEDAWRVIDPNLESYQNMGFGAYAPGLYWLNALHKAEMAYRKLRELGWKAQQARTVLPNSTKTEIVVTANYRQWRTMFKQRAVPAAHPQMREVMIPLLREMRERTPVLFEDIVEAVE